MPTSQATVLQTDLRLTSFHAMRCWSRTAKWNLSPQLQDIRRVVHSISTNQSMIVLGVWMLSIARSCARPGTGAGVFPLGTRTYLRVPRSRRRALFCAETAASCNSISSWCRFTLVKLPRAVLPPAVDALLRRPAALRNTHGRMTACAACRTCPAHTSRFSASEYLW